MMSRHLVVGKTACILDERGGRTNDKPSFHLIFIVSSVLRPGRLAGWLAHFQLTFRSIKCLQILPRILLLLWIAPTKVNLLIGRAVLTRIGYCCCCCCSVSFSASKLLTVCENGPVSPRAWGRRCVVSSELVAQVRPGDLVEFWVYWGTSPGSLGGFTYKK